MSEGTSSGTNQRFLPFWTLSENRVEPFTSDVEVAAVFALADLDRAKGGGLIMKQPEERIAFIAKLGYPLWLFSWSEIALTFDGLNQAKYALSYVAVPDVNAFVENLGRGAKTRETHLAFLNDNGVDAKCHYPIAIHQQEGYPWGKQARIAGPIPNSERNAACCVSLPMFPELTEEEVDYAIEKVLAWDRSAR